MKTTATRSQPVWRAESDGARHARTFYVVKGFARIDCVTMRDARHMASLLNRLRPLAPEETVQAGHYVQWKHGADAWSPVAAGSQFVGCVAALSPLKFAELRPIE